MKVDKNLYFNLADMKSTFKNLDEWLRKRIRLCYCKQWKRIKTKHDNLKRIGINEYKVWEYEQQEKAIGGYVVAHFSKNSNVIKYLKNKGFIILTEKIYGRS